MQFVDRSAGRGREQVKFHGVVTCLRVMGNTAEIAGVERDTDEPFNLRVVDSGEGANAMGADMIEFDDDDDVDDDDCGDDNSDDEEPEFVLARGNAQVYDNGQ